MGTERRQRGVSLTELLVVVMIVGLISAFAQFNLFGVFHRQTFKASVQDFVNTLQMAGYAAAESDRRFSVIIDREEGYYLLREIKNGSLSGWEEDEIVDLTHFGPTCEVLEVRYDDGDYLKEDQRALFVSGRAGWMYGGKVVLRNTQGEIFSVVINRISRKVELVDGYVDLPEPRDETSMTF